MRVLMHDFAGHAFAAQLSRELAKHGHIVAHAYCGGVAAGKGDLKVRSCDPSTLTFHDIFPEPFERYMAFRRILAELRYGLRAARLVHHVRPDVIISANSPLLAQGFLWSGGRLVKARRVYWLQDLLGIGTSRILAGRFGGAGRLVGRLFEHLEFWLLRHSSGIVAISEDFVATLRERKIRGPVTVIENWAPLDEIPVQPKCNAWSSAEGLDQAPVVLYSGTLGLKHDPLHLLAAATHIATTGGTLVVVSEGIGRELLEKKAKHQSVTNIRFYNYFDFTMFPLVLAAADLCLVLLERDAATFSVPSKVLSYLAAGRPIVAAVPSENLCAVTIAKSQSGVCVPPGDYELFAHSVRELLSDSQRLVEMGTRARAYAEQAFAISKIMQTFLSAPGMANMGYAH